MDKITSLIKPELADTESLMQKEMQTEISMIADITNHISAGGKRIRPAVVILTAKALSKYTASTTDLAATVEFIHTATLLHDDVVDSSKMRRGKPSANMLWGNEASVLVGDFLYSRAFQLLVKTGKLGLLDILSNASNIMAEGEVLQLMNCHNQHINEETYFKVIEAKTSALFSAATSMSAMLSDGDEATVQAFQQYGHHLGLAFQLIDDALDYNSDAETLGKNVGDDLAEGKVTLPLIHALHHSESKDKAIIERVIATGELDHLHAIQQAINTTNATGYTIESARKHAELAKAALNHIETNEYTDALKSLADFVVNRDF